MNITKNTFDAQRALAWSPIPEAANRQAFLEVVRLEGSLPVLHLTVTVASRYPADRSVGPLTAAWCLSFHGVVSVQVEPAYHTQQVSIPLPDDRSATWKVASSRALAALEANPLPGLAGAALEHFAIHTLHSHLYQIVARSCTGTPLEGEEAETALTTYERQVDGLLAQARR